MPKILIVEDDAQLAKVIAHKLRKSGHTCVHVTNGDDALKTVLVDKPDLILLDVLMPGIDGLEVRRRLLAMPSMARIPVIYLSGNNREEDILKGLELGAIDYVTKPFSVNVLCAKITNVLDLLDTR